MKETILTTTVYEGGDIDQAITDYGHAQTPKWVMEVDAWQTDGHRDYTYAYRYLRGPLLELPIDYDEDHTVDIRATIHEEIRVPHEGGPAVINRDGFVALGGLDTVAPGNIDRLSAHITAAADLLQVRAGS